MKQWPALLLTGAGITVLALVGVFALRGGSIEQLDAQLAPAGADHGVQPRINQQPVSTGSDLPTVQQGSQPDGSIRFDGHGRLVVELDLRRRFDWYLGALATQSFATIKQRLQRDLAQLMTPPQAAQVLELFDRYCAYLQAADQLPEDADLAVKLAAIHRLRVEKLKDAAGPFFDAEEREIARALNPDAERKGDGAAADAGQAHYQQTYDQYTANLQALQSEQQLTQSTASPGERRQQREALYGAEAAQRLAALDQERSAWDARVQAYIQQRNALHARTDLSAAEQQRRELQLQTGFTPAERIRLTALTSAPPPG